jgi:hypothetical protein
MDLEIQGLQGLHFGPTPKIAVDLGQISGLNDDFMTHYMSALYS